MHRLFQKWEDDKPLMSDVDWSQCEFSRPRVRMEFCVRLLCFLRCFLRRLSSMLGTALNYDLFSTVTFSSLRDDGWEVAVVWLCDYEDDVVK